MSEVSLEFLARQIERVLEGQRRIDGRLGELRADMIEVKGRLGALEEQYASVSRRVDRLDGSLERIERRLDLREAEPAE